MRLAYKGHPHCKISHPENMTSAWGPCSESHGICLRELKKITIPIPSATVKTTSSASRKVAAQTRTVGIGLTQNQGFAWLVGGGQAIPKTASAATWLSEAGLCCYVLCAPAKHISGFAPVVAVNVVEMCYEKSLLHGFQHQKQILETGCTLRWPGHRA